MTTENEDLRLKVYNPSNTLDNIDRYVQVFYRPLDDSFIDMMIEDATVVFNVTHGGTYIGRTFNLIDAKRLIEIRDGIAVDGEPDV